MFNIQVNMEPHVAMVVCRDLDVLLLPLLHMLYASVGQAASQVYMLLIVVLILSQDPDFSRTVHAISLSSVPWYSERLLKDTSLGAAPEPLSIPCGLDSLARSRSIRNPNGHNASSFVHQIQTF